jgi:hypothetical protein
VTTLAGLPGVFGSTDGTGSDARFNQPDGLALDSKGNLYVPDSFNNTIRVGTPHICPDLPTLDLGSGPAGQKRQLDTSPQTATAWQWSLIRRPANSLAELSDPNVRNPTFTPDVADLYVFQLRASSDSGRLCIRTISLLATSTPPSIEASSLTLVRGQFGFAFQSPPGSSLTVQVSTDLSSWTVAATVTNLTGTTFFADPISNYERSFYRLQQQ